MSRIITTCIALLVCLTFVRTEETVEEGAYGNVFVSFSQNVPSGKGHILLDKLQEHLIETSNLLRNAINLGISKVTFVIPRSWDASTLSNITVEPLLSESDVRADILVDDVQNSVFGTFPLAQQHGSCGIPGARIVVPSDFLTENNDRFPKGTALAREWLKYRYGVFDENGYTGDELYPVYYNVPGGHPTDVTVTDCTNKHVVYNFTNSNGDECTPYTGKETTDECRAHPEEESLENVTSSLMYFHEKIHNMQHVCGKDPEHPHSSRSRNKHNSLCRGQSVWDVLKMSGDFGDFNSSESEIASADSYDIQFNFVQEPKPRVVIAFEYTEHLEAQHEAVLKAVRKFLYDLPAGSKYALLPFMDSIPAEPEYHFQELNKWPDDWKSITMSSLDFIEEKEGCVKCAIEKALDIVASENPNEPSDTVGTAIIIASSNTETDEDLLGKLKNSKMCLMLLAFGKGETPKAYQDYTDASPCGSLVELSLDGTEKEVFETLFEAMESILPETVGDKITETVKTESSPGEKNVPISFPVNAETVEKVTFWILRDSLKMSDLSVVEKATIDGNEIKLTKDDTAQVSSFSFFPEKSGSVEFKLSGKIAALVQVRITSKPGKYISGDIHFHDTTKGKSEEQMPVILYARVRFGSYPVQNAEVSAEISRPEEQPVSVKMYDDGSGDPDITANDGVYSGYFIDFSEKGEYEVTVTVKNKEDETIAGKLNHKGGYESCCGSKLETGTVQIPSFEKTFKKAFSARSGPPENGYQPSRIVDLRVDNVTDDKVVLKWTAPGAQADKGTASKYEMKLFCERGENATDCNLYKMVKLLNKPPPKIYGSKQKVTVQILDKSQTLSMGIVTINEKKQESDLSNTIEIFKPDHDIEEITINPDTKDKDEVTPTQRAVIGSSIAGGIILICIIIGIVCFCQNKQRKKYLNTNDIEATTNENGTQASNANKASDYSTSGSPVRKVESFPVLLYTHDQLKDLKRKDRDPPLYKNDVQSKSWVSLNVLSNSKTNDNCETDTKSLSSLTTVPIDSSMESNKTNKF